MTAVILVGLLAFFALAYVSTPLRRPEPAMQDETYDPPELEDRKIAALTGILDIEEERAVGKLTPAEFEALRARYEADAIEALHALDGLERHESDPLEAEIAEMKRKLVCPECGAPRGRTGSCETCASS